MAVRLSRITAERMLELGKNEKEIVQRLNEGYGEMFSFRDGSIWCEGEEVIKLKGKECLGKCQLSSEPAPICWQHGGLSMRKPCN